MYLINPTFTKQMMVKLSVALNDLQDEWPTVCVFDPSDVEKALCRLSGNQSTEISYIPSMLILTLLE